MNYELVKRHRTCEKCGSPVRKVLDGSWENGLHLRPEKKKNSKRVFKLGIGKANEDRRQRWGRV